MNGLYGRELEHDDSSLIIVTFESSKLSLVVMRFPPRLERSGITASRYFPHWSSSVIVICITK